MQNYVYDKEIYDVFEGMTSISAIISSILNSSSKRKIIKILYNQDKKKSKYNELKFLEHKSYELGFELIGTSHTVIDELANGKTHGGIINYLTVLKIHLILLMLSVQFMLRVQMGLSFLAIASITLKD